eukprot:m.86427 g.86427  ORF g.86427 m.86427 type:complete len:128 (-) comp14876_c0_seq3:120-503(-)
MSDADNLGDRCVTLEAEDLPGAWVQITDAGQVYSTVSGSKHIAWPSAEWEAMGSKTTWDGYYPKNGHRGVVVHTWVPGAKPPGKSWNAKVICLLQIDEAFWEGKVEAQPFVPVGSDGLNIYTELPPK